MTQSFYNQKNQLTRSMTEQQFEEIVGAIVAGKYSWACVLILQTAGYNPLHYIPYRTYNRLIKDNCLNKSNQKVKSAQKQSSNQVKSAQQSQKCSSRQRSHKIQDLNYIENLNEQTQEVMGGYQIQTYFDLIIR
ncbi:MAG: HetP family heterocyst commitment protein [Crocosphaera sp.]|nr:HetP family heterocyst commitment protein [Crocosphaera sp.]